MQMGKPAAAVPRGPAPGVDRCTLALTTWACPVRAIARGDMAHVSSVAPVPARRRDRRMDRRRRAPRLGAPSDYREQPPRVGGGTVWNLKILSRSDARGEGPEVRVVPIVGPSPALET